MENDTLESEEESQVVRTPPRDPCYMAWWTMLLCGAGFLFPYNSFVNAVDYFNSRYPGRPIEFQISVAYLWCTLASMFINVRIMHLVSLERRIYFGYTVFLVMLTLVMLLEPAMARGSISVDTGYSLTIIAAGCVGIGGGVQQASYYGYAAVFPPTYTRALMTGEGVAGLLVSLFRISTKAAYGEEGLYTSIFIYFSISIGWILLCTLLFTGLRFRAISRYYRNAAKDLSESEGAHGSEGAAILEGTGDEEGGRRNEGTSLLLAEQEDDEAVLETKNGRALLDDDEEEDETRRHSERVHGGEGEETDDVSAEDRVVPYKSLFGRIRATVWPDNRQRVFKIIWEAALAVSLVFFLTLSLFPGVLTEAKSEKLGDWWPVILIALFNGTDLIGKLLNLVPIEIAPSRQYKLALVRFVFIPWLVLCAAPSSAPVLSSEWTAALGVVLMGLTSGFLGTYAMVTGPKLVAPEDRELAGNVMTLLLMIGLALGSTFALLLKVFIDL